MKKILDMANNFCAESDWKIIALLKFCLMSIGVMIGVSLPCRTKKTAAFIAAAVFICTYVPLILKVFEILLRRPAEAAQED